MGRNEVYYSFEYFYPGGFSPRKEFCNYDSNFVFLPCIAMQIINWLIFSNLIDVFLLTKIAFILKSQRNSAQNLLTPGALLQRKR